MKDIEKERHYSKYLDEFWYAASIGAAHAVHFVHDHEALARAAVRTDALAQHYISHLLCVRMCAWGRA